MKSYRPSYFIILPIAAGSKPSTSGSTTEVGPLNKWMGVERALAHGKERFSQPFCFVISGAWPGDASGCKQSQVGTALLQVTSRTSILLRNQLIFRYVPNKIRIGEGQEHIKAKTLIYFYRMQPDSPLKTTCIQSQPHPPLPVPWVSSAMSCL